jgi:hypothetical protein
MVWFRFGGGHSGRQLERCLDRLAQWLHVEVDGAVEPFLVLLACKGADQAQTARLIRKNAHDVGAALDLLVEALEEVRALKVFVVLKRTAEKGPRLLDILLNPCAQPWMFEGPFFDPWAQLKSGFGRTAQIVEPA